MPQKEVGRQDLFRLLRLLDQIAQMHAEYLRRGFKVKDIAKTFSEIYLSRLTHVTDDNLASFLFPVTIPTQSKITRQEAVERIGLETANAFIAIVIDRMKRRHANED